MQGLKETIQLYEARLNAWYEEGCEVPHANQVPPVIQGSTVPLSVTQYYSVCKV